MSMRNQVYDCLKWVALVLLPALIVALKQLLAIQPWQQGAFLIECLQIFAVFLGAILQLSNYNYRQLKGAGVLA